MSDPTVSIIMSVYNGAALVPAAIESLRTQTYEDFELIAIDDCSPADNTREVLHRIAAKTGDPRIRVVELDRNLGLAGALNHGISLARGRYIARQDHDDLSLPTRLENQVRFLDANPGCGLVGTRAEIWVGDTRTDRNHDHAVDNASLQLDLLSNNPFVHTSIMMTREAVSRVGVYTTDPARQPPEDFELWSRIAREFEVANLPERLVIYKETPGSISRVGPNPFLEKLLLLSAENIAWWNGLAEPDSACHDAAALLHASYDRLSPATDLNEIVARVRRACGAIAERTGSTLVAARGEDIVANLRHHFGLARRLPEWASPFLSLSRRLPLPAALRNWAKARLSS